MGNSEGTSPALPVDILVCIFATLETPDLVRAGSVCSSWRSAYTLICNLGLAIRKQTPCLLYTSESAGDNAACLYSLVEKKAYTIKLPDPPIRRRYVIGSSYGWLITADERSELLLVNPITAEQIALPSVTTIEQVKPILDDTCALHMYEYSWYNGKKYYYPPSILALDELRKFLFVKAVLSDDPSAGNYIVALIHMPFWQLSFARAGDNKWTWLPPCRNYDDCFIKDGFLYALTQRGEIQAFDLNSPAVTCRVLMENVKEIIDEQMYIVQAPCGDMLQIWRTCHPLGYEEEEEEEEEDAAVSGPETEPESIVGSTTMIELYKVETDKKLVKISCLGEDVLFVGPNQSLCLCAEEYPQLKANHVYFTDDHEDLKEGSKNETCDIGVFSLENNSQEGIVSSQLWSNWPRPVWLVPNPRKMNVRSLN